MKKFFKSRAWFEIKIVIVVMLIFLPLLWLLLSWLATADFTSTPQPFMRCYEYGNTFECWWN